MVDTLEKQLTPTSVSFESLDILERIDATVDESPILQPIDQVFRRCHVWGVDFDCITMDDAVDWIDLIVQNKANTYAITANLNYLMLCDQSPRLKNFTKRCPLVLCDGKPIQWRSRLEKHRLPERVAGSDLIYRLAELSARQNYSMFLLGGADGVAKQTSEKLTELNPGLRIAGHHSPPHGRWSNAVEHEMRQRIIDANPDILLVAFGQPKGEYWIEENFRQLCVPISIQVGASFDFVVGKARRAPKLMQTIGAEWLYRAIRDPRRLFPRYLSNALFLSKAIRSELLQRLN
jgi:N-acetylglucosaminyldiphosphoundecaprenol N-acetyl-beta-D-mannosaminyltransferase